MVAEGYARGLWQGTRGGGVLLHGIASPAAIICAVPEDGDRHGEAEYLVDRQGLSTAGVLARFAVLAP